MKIWLACVLLFGFLTPGVADADRAAEQKLLKRVYEMRLRLEQDRQRAENEARANVRLVAQANGARQGVDSPTVSQMRRDMNVQLARFESQFECLDVEVENNGGNTVVICGGNSGDVEGTNVSAGRDIVTVQGAQQ